MKSVLLVEDHAVFRQALTLVLEQDTELLAALSTLEESSHTRSPYAATTRPPTIGPVGAEAPGPLA